jgi:peptide/nickel transport system ATP-binding protein
VLEVSEVTVDYLLDRGTVRAVDDVSFSVGRGEFLGIVGESGCGKSTLLFAVAQLLSPPAVLTGGSVQFKGQNLVGLTEGQLATTRWLDMSVVMQSAMNALNPVKSIGAQFRDVLRAHGIGDRDKIAARSAEVLRMVGIDPLHLKSYPHQLSGGMRQRSMIAMALLFTPDLIIMDEPTSALDVVAQRSLMVQIKELQAAFGFAVIFVTHDMSLISHFSDRLMVMYAGQVSELGVTRTVFDRPQHPVHPRPPGSAQGHPREPAGPGLSPGRLPVQAAVPVRGREVRTDTAGPVPAGRGPRPVRAPQGREPGMTAELLQAELLRAEHLTRHFKIGGSLSRRTLHAVDDVSFAIGEREIVALAGESGSGKSTIARLLARIYKPTSGEVYFEGKPLSAIRSRRDALRYSGQVPMVFQDPFASINPVFRVQHGVLRGLKLHRPSLSASQRADEAARAFEVVGLGSQLLNRFPHELSGGQRQRVGFAQALAMRPKLILADEPVSMLDVSIRIGVLNLMARLRDEEGVSILYITHDIASARYVADRLIVLYAGQIAEAGPIEEVLSGPRHPYTQLLLSAVPDPRAPLSVGAEAGLGEPPKVIDPSPGCRFRWRCPLAIDTCSQVTPALAELAPGHQAACHVAKTTEVKAFS